MKKFDRLKTVQLILFALLTVACGVIVYTNKELFHLIGVNPSVKLIAILLWLALGLAFLFIFLDYSYINNFKQDFRELDFAVHSDPVAGIANRYSSDMLIEKYLDKPLPKDMAIIMLDLNNLGYINKTYGHAKGNELIKEFSYILRSTARNLCHVGRNGGNKFIVIFEECDDQAIADFLDKVERKVSSNNEKVGKFPIEYSYGTAFHEGEAAKAITDLISLANRRITE